MPVKVPPIREFPADGRTWRIDWFGAVERAAAEARIEVHLIPVKAGIQRPTDPREHFEAETRKVWIGVGQLPFLAIGSFWLNGRRRADWNGTELSLPPASISPVVVQLVNAGLKLDEGKWAVPPFALRLGEDLRLSKCIAIQHDGDPYAILLPVVEAIRFYYAVSTDLAHITFSGGLRISPNEIYDPSFTGLLRDRGRMVVRLRQWLSDDDGWIIGRALACPIAGAGMARVYTSLLTNSVNQSPKFPECRLPFEGTTQWNARGRVLPGRVPGAKRWLIYELLRCTSSFPFDELEVMRTNDSTRADPETDLPEEEKRPGWAMAVGTPKLSGDEFLQSQSEPDVSTSVIQIPLAGERFASLMGKKIHKTLKEECRYRSASFATVAKVDSLSTGDASSGDATVGRAKGVSTNERLPQRCPVPASLDTMHQLVDALCDVVGSRAWVRPSEADTAFMPLTKASRWKQWSYLESTTRIRRRVIIVDIVAGDRAASIIEFEQRLSESYVLALLQSSCGALVTDAVLATLLRSVATKEGVWASIEIPVSYGIRIKGYRHGWSDMRLFAARVASDVRAGLDFGCVDRNSLRKPRDGSE